MTIYTIGYEGKTIDAFCHQLVTHCIETLVDVRELPLSRKKGFSKTPLAEHLQNYEIKYVHVKQLGTPRPMRQKLRNNGDYTSFFREYDLHVLQHMDVVQELVQSARKERLSLMCFEASHTICHRNQLSLYFAAAGLNVIHLP